jgi:hypothetical protein
MRPQCNKMQTPRISIGVDMSGMGQIGRITDARRRASARLDVAGDGGDRLLDPLRADPGRRLRAHLLWTLNPLLLWDVVAAGHLDVLAAAAGLLGLLALAASTAWLLLWPYQYPWYATMIICLLIFYPASRLDWLVLAPVAVGTITAPLGIAEAQLGRAADLIHDFSISVLSPLVLLAAAAGLVALSLSGRWNPGEPDPGQNPRPTCPGSARTAG